MKISYKAVMSLLGAIVLVLQNLGMSVEPALVDDIVTGIAGLLVALGVVLPKKSEKDDE